MTYYEIPKLDREHVLKVAQTWRGDYSMKNSLRDDSLEIEGDRAGYRAMAVDFLLLAVEGYHKHLQSRGQVPSGWVFETGFEISIGRMVEGGDTRAKPISPFRYLAEPVHGVVRMEFLPNSTCFSHMNDEFVIEGNVPALLSLAQHCLSLAEPDTPEGSSVEYVPGIHLDETSVRFMFRRI